MTHPTAHMRQRAKSLRRSPTISEQRLWKWLRKRTFGGYKFRRQAPMSQGLEVVRITNELLAKDSPMAGATIAAAIERREKALGVSRRERIRART